MGFIINNTKTDLSSLTTPKLQVAAKRPCSISPSSKASFREALNCHDKGDGNMYFKQNGRSAYQYWINDMEWRRLLQLHCFDVPLPSGSNVAGSSILHQMHLKFNSSLDHDFWCIKFRGIAPNLQSPNEGQYRRGSVFVVGCYHHLPSWYFI